MPDEIRDLELLLKAHHPLLVVESLEEERVATLLEHVADRLGLPLFTWRAHDGLRRDALGTAAAGAGPHSSGALVGTDNPEHCLAFIQDAQKEGIFHLRDFSSFLDQPSIAARLKEIYRKLFEHRGAVVLNLAQVELPTELAPLFTHFELAPLSLEALHAFVSDVVRNIRARMPVTVDLSQEDVSQLLQNLRGLTLFEVKKIVTKAVVENGRLDRNDIKRVMEAKREVVMRSGVLEYFPHDTAIDDVAGLNVLKDWLSKRRSAFHDAARAREFGLTPPKGLLLLGVQGCGKSLCAKAVASSWQLPLLRLDPSSLYTKYFGESEKNLRRAIRTAEGLAPVVLWIDEIEKAFSDGGDQDGGTSQRVFGSFLSWLQEKQDSVFVIATANDIQRLPPELLRKGRFDEIFFVDLPDAEVRSLVFGVHLRRRNRDPNEYDLTALGDATDGFSGAEIEQVVVSALYTAFAAQGSLTTDLLLKEIRATRPLSVTMAERIDALRAWAKDRAVPANRS